MRSVITFSCISLLTFFASSPFCLSQINLDSGLVAYYPFTGNAGDSGMFGNHGTAMGATLTADRFGNPNSAYSFDGIDDFIDIVNYTNMSPTDAFSISAWIKSDGSSNVPYIYDRIEQNDGFGLRLKNSGDLQLTINGGQIYVESRCVDMNDGNWHHVFASYDRIAGVSKVYLDGILMSRDTSYSSMITYTPEPRNGIGGIGQNNSNFFEGDIDDVRIYNRALTSCEVLTLAGESVDLQNGLVGYYPMSGNANDWSGQGNDGTVIGATLVSNRYGNPNSCFTFDGMNDQIEIQNYTNMSPTDAFTIAAWIRTSSASTIPYIYDRVDQNDGFGLRLTSNGNLRVTVNGGNAEQISARVVTDGLWHYVATTYNRLNNKLALFIDGQELETVGCNAISISYLPEPRNGIGGPGKVNNFFSGEIDDLRVYTRDLSNCEISYLYDNDQLLTSIADITDDVGSNDLSVGPNPVSDVVEFVGMDKRNLDQRFTFYLFNVNGQMIVKEQFFGNYFAYRVDSHSPALYMYRIISSDSKSIYHGRIVIGKQD